MDRPGRETVHLSFRMGSTGKRHERRVQGGGEVVGPQKLLSGEEASSAAFTSGHTVPTGTSRCRCPGAPASVREPIAPDGAGLDRVTRIVAEHGVYGEGVRPQRVQARSSSDATPSASSRLAM